MKNIPNILSAFRILLIPVFIWEMVRHNTLAAALVLLLSGITDFLDGFLARHFNWVSAVGKVLDPVADKLTQATVCIVLLVRMPQYWFFFAALLFKELMMLTLGGYLLRHGIKLEGARWFGKVVTTLFYIVMVAILFFPAMPTAVAMVALGVTTVCAFAAGFLYIPEFLRYRAQFTEKDKKEPQGK